MESTRIQRNETLTRTQAYRNIFPVVHDLALIQSSSDPLKPTLTGQEGQSFRRRQREMKRLEGETRFIWDASEGEKLMRVSDREIVSPVTSAPSLTPAGGPLDARTASRKNTESLLELSETLGIDLKEQVRIMEEINDKKMNKNSPGHPGCQAEGRQDCPSSHTRSIASRSGSTSLAEPVSCQPSDQTFQTAHASRTLEIAPGVEMKLRDSQETWKAIIEGRTIVAPCCVCGQELTVVEDAQVLGCADCWVFSPTNSLVHPLNGVCIGVKPEDIDEWLVIRYL